MPLSASPRRNTRSPPSRPSSSRKKARSQTPPFHPTDALGRTATHTYDGAGRLLASTDRNGDTITYQYDADGNLVTKTLPGADVTTYTYDAFGHMTAAANASAQLSFSYDAAGRLISSTSTGTATASRPTVTHTYTHDGNGNRLSVSSATGVLEYSYDANDRLLTLTDYAGGDFIFDHDSLGRLVGLSRPNGVDDTLTYDSAGHLLSRNASSAAAMLGRAEYTYDAAGLRTSTTNLDGTSTYAYDPINQLTGATHPAASGIANESYSYDLAGNRTAPRGPATYSANEQLLQDATYDYAYDLEGNMISRTLRSDPSEVTSYAWDAEHRLIEVQLPDVSHVTYRYDPLGNRIEIAHGSDIKRYVYDEGQIVAEYDGANDLVATFVHTPSGHSPLEMERDGQRYCHVVDAQGSTTALVDMSGAIVERNRYL